MPDSAEDRTRDQSKRLPIRIPPPFECTYFNLYRCPFHQLERQFLHPDRSPVFGKQDLRGLAAHGAMGKRHRGQRRVEPRGDLDLVVETRNGNVVGNGRPFAAQRGIDLHGHAVIAAQDGIGAPRTVHERLHMRGHEAVRPVAVDRLADGGQDDGAGSVDAGLIERPPETEFPEFAGEQPRQIDEGDVAAAGIDEIVGNLQRRPRFIGHQRGDAVVGIPAIDHDADGIGKFARQVDTLVIHRGIGDRPRAKTSHFVEDRGDAPVAAKCHGKDSHVGGAHGAIEAPDDLGRKRRGDQVVGDKADERHPALPHAARGEVGDITELLSNFLDPLPGFLRHARRSAMQCARHRLDGDTCADGYVAE
ncbi:hypothetical protein RHECNPAF_14110037 [Rhizobium etli CNPAF512]|nr:hypothetical protein RHECNPAF_14110037 [Rhizobium etli CNPAF512]